jgi:hypothetical protein
MGASRPRSKANTGRQPPHEPTRSPDTAEEVARMTYLKSLWDEYNPHAGHILDQLFSQLNDDHERDAPLLLAPASATSERQTAEANRAQQVDSDRLRTEERS